MNTFMIDTTARPEEADLPGAAMRLLEAEEPADYFRFTVYAFTGEPGQHGFLSNALDEVTFETPDELDAHADELESVTLPWLRACAAAWRTIEKKKEEEA